MSTTNIKKTITKKIPNEPPGNVRHTLRQLLKEIKPVDFRKKSNLESHQELSQKHYLVIAIDELIITALQNDWGLVINQKKVYVYNGTHWQQVEKDDLNMFLGIAAHKMGVEKFDAKFFMFRDKLVKQFTSTAHMPTPDRPQEVTLINLKNGTYEITPEKRELREFRRNDFLKYQLPFNFDENSECPKFMGYLNRVLPDESMQQILSEFLGYVFISTQTLKLEKTLLSYGSGSNGKSVNFDVTNALFGKENISNFTLESLTGTNGYFRASLADKLLNYSSEISNRMNVDLFKQLVSGEPVEARQIYGKPHMLENYAKLMFNCNELPLPTQHKDAYFRRFIIIPFEQKIPPEEQNPRLAQEIISEELPGVFNWVLAGLERLLKNKRFTESDKVNAILNKYKTETDTVRHFLNESKLSPGVEREMHLKEMYINYIDFCKDEHSKAHGKTSFSNYLRELGYHINRKNIGMVVSLSKK